MPRGHINLCMGKTEQTRVELGGLENEYNP
jgi:hypothetical protein